MMHLLLSVLVALVAISIIPTVFSESLREDFAIPDWVKNNAGWWADEQIDDAVFFQTVEFLINEEIITVQIPTVDSEFVEEVPGWVKNTAGWWAEGKIHDITFVGAIKYLISQGIMTVEQEQEAEILPPCPHKIISGYACIVEEVVEVNDFYMELNGYNCCRNWAYVGKDYLLQIETLDGYRGNPIDSVTITAKIISKGGELRYDFGQITTEDGIHKNNITIPSMDWYAGNVLSVTGTYNGVEKTIEKEFEVFRERNISYIKSYYGQITSTAEINDFTTNGPALFRSGQETKYGWSAANIGDLDGDGVNDLAVGQEHNVSGCSTQVNKGAVQIHFLNADGTLKSTKVICESTTGISLFNGAQFGSSVTGLGDIDGDGVPDIAVGAYMTGTNNRGEIDIILMNSDGSVKDQVVHRSGGGVGTLGGGTQLGYSVENIGDLNRDGTNDIAMGGWNCDCGGANDSGLVIIGFLTSSGTLDSVVKIQRGTTNGPSLTASDKYGGAIANIGDLDGDGVQDIAVASKNDAGDSGEIHIHYMNTDGSIKSTVELNDNHISQLATTVAVALEGLGDIDGDGVGDMAVGLKNSDVTGTDRGGVLLVYLNSNGSAKSIVEFNDSSSNGPTLAGGDLFGSSIANMGDLDGYAKFMIVGTSFKGDLDGNNVIELAVGAKGDDMDSAGDPAGATNRGATHILFLR